jgi:dephospho-CoA kinase
LKPPSGARDCETVLIAGLTGGLACGKSFVAEEFRRLGCHVVEADELGHEVLLPGGKAYAPAIGQFGPEILNADGRIDRARLAQAVFGDPSALAKLNAIVHPAVHELAQERFREIAQEDPHAIVIYVAAILVETGAWRDFDKLIVVECSSEAQIERALKRPNATQADVEARLGRQLPPEAKRPHAHYVIQTDGAKEDTLRQTRMVFEDLRCLKK